MLLNMLQNDADYRKTVSVLLKDPWISGNQTSRIEKSPFNELSQRNNIVGTIEKYKKIYGSNRRNIIQRTNNSSDAKKQVTSTSPYNCGTRANIYQKKIVNSFKSSGMQKNMQGLSQ